MKIWVLERVIYFFKVYVIKLCLWVSNFDEWNFIQTLFFITIWTLLSSRKFNKLIYFKRKINIRILLSTPSMFISMYRCIEFTSSVLIIFKVLKKKRTFYSICVKLLVLSIIFLVCILVFNNWIFEFSARFLSLTCQYWWRYVSEYS